MRDLFPGYRRLTDADLEKLWAECCFVFDASALLDMYRVTTDTRDQFLGIIAQLKDRIWLPHQAGLEFYDNRLEVIATGQGAYARISQMAADAVNQFRKGLDNYRQYRWVQADRWIEVFERGTKEIQQGLEEQDRVLNELEKNDTVEQALHDLFSGRVGEPFQDMNDIYERAELRLQLNLPPGFKDAGKKDFHRYGDVVLWFQLLDFARARKRGIIFVTSDSKTDWWLVTKGQTIGPRPELMQEMFSIASATFHMYTPHRFIEYAHKFLGLKDKMATVQKAAKELQEVEEEKAASTQRHKQFDYALAQLATNFKPIDPNYYTKLMEGFKPLDVEYYAKLMEGFKPLDVEYYAKLMEGFKPLDTEHYAKLIGGFKPLDAEYFSKLTEGFKPLDAEYISKLTGGFKPLEPDYFTKLMEHIEPASNVQTSRDLPAKAEESGSEQQKQEPTKGSAAEYEAQNKPEDKKE